MLRVWWCFCCVFFFLVLLPDLVYGFAADSLTVHSQLDPQLKDLQLWTMDLLCHQPIIHKTEYENTFSKNGYGTHHLQRFMCFFQNVTMWLKTFKYTCQWQVSFFFGFEVLYKCKNKHEKWTFYHFFGKKKVTRFAKNWKSCRNISLLVLVW